MRRISIVSPCLKECPHRESADRFVAASYRPYDCMEISPYVRTYVTGIFFDTAFLDEVVSDSFFFFFNMWKALRAQDPTTEPNSELNYGQVRAKIPIECMICSMAGSART